MDMKDINNTQVLLGGLAALMAAHIALLLLMNVSVMCACGELRVWAAAGESSRQLADWYSISHALHGVLFYWLLVGLRPQWPVQAHLLAATALEVAWEVLENTPWVIHRYRTATAATEYSGDTLVNSVADVGFMLLGFYVALKLPWKLVLALLVAGELVALYVIRDNLTLQIVTFLWPIDALVDWQSRG